MQTLVWRPTLTNLLKKPCLSSRQNASTFSQLRPRAFSSSSDHSNQSRGGLPRFHSEILPVSKELKDLNSKGKHEKLLEILKGGSLRWPSDRLYHDHQIDSVYEGDHVFIQGDEFFHMTRVLRLGVNDRVELFNGKGGLVEGCIQIIDCTGVDIMAMESAKLLPPQTTQWHVYAAFGALKGGRADWLVEKCTELGATTLTPLLTEHSPSISENRLDRLQRVILAASKQCQRLHEMTLNPPSKIGVLLPTVAQSKLSFIGVAEATPIFNSLGPLRRESSGIMIIGPEGDFTQRELSTFVEAGATPVGLGPYRLRVETATIALLSTLLLWSHSRTLE